MLGEGTECGGSSYTSESDDDNEDSASDKTSYSFDDEETSNGGRGARGRIQGASDRHSIDTTGDARVGCAKGLVCARIGLDRMECRPEKPEGERRLVTLGFKY